MLDGALERFDSILGLGCPTAVEHFGQKKGKQTFLLDYDARFVSYFL